jgi:hypothetical protein
MVKTITNGELAAIAVALEAAAAKDIVMPPKVSYKIIKNKITVKRALAPFETARDDIIKKKSGGKGSINATEEPEIYAEVMTAINEIARETAEIEIATISIDDIPESGVPISFISALDFMIEGE